jgi:hypothetical protein
MKGKYKPQPFVKGMLQVILPDIFAEIDFPSFKNLGSLGTRKKFPVV